MLVDHEHLLLLKHPLDVALLRHFTVFKEFLASWPRHHLNKNSPREAKLFYSIYTQMTVSKWVDEQEESAAGG